MLQRLKRIARRVVYGRRAPVNDTQELTEPTGPQSDALEFMNSQRIAKNAESLIKRQVTKLDFNSSYLVIEGSAWFEKYPEKDAERIIKSLILINDQAEEIEIPLVNTTVERPGFPASGYHGDVNFSTISDGKPLIPGTYEIKLQLQQYLGNGWLIRRTSIGQIVDTHQDLNYTTKMTSYSAKSNKSYSLIFRYSLASQALKVTSYKLSDVNPLENEFTEDVGLDSAAMRAIKRRALKLWYRWYCLQPIHKKQISFVSDSRVTISGNFEFIYQELKRRNTDFKISFYLKPSIKTKNPGKRFER